MKFKYSVLEKDGGEKKGEIEAVNIDVAIGSLQSRGYVITSIDPADKVSFFNQKIDFFERVSNKDIVMLSKQMSTLFGAQISALKIFNLLSAEAENPLLRSKLAKVADDIKNGNTLSKSLEKHPAVFSDFYVNMVRSGEESGKLDQILEHLAKYLERSYELTTKAKNALIYPAFVIFTFIVVMVLMLTTVIPKITTIIEESGQEMPIYTKIVVGISTILTSYGLILLVLLIIGGFFLWKYLKTEKGKLYFASIKISIPFLGNLYKKLYLSRIADNMHTMLVSGVSMVRSLEITSTVVGNEVYKNIMLDVLKSVKNGRALSDSFLEHEEIPRIMSQMVKVGEETGSIGKVLETLSSFYRREVSNAVDTLVGLIEPVMLVLLALGVGVLLASVLIPIYNISSGV